MDCCLDRGRTPGKEDRILLSLDDVVRPINEGKELGEADDIVFGKNNSKQADGR